MSGTLGDLGAEVASTTRAYNGTTSVFDTYDYYIHPHWKQFGPIPDHWHYLVGIYITIVGITGIIGNSIVIWIFSTTRNLKTPSNMFIINLALSDLIFSAVNGFPLLTISAFNKKWMWGDSACQFYGFIGGLFGLMSINTLAAISFDRYLNIARPLSAAKNMTRRKAFMMIVMVWFWSLVWSVPPIFGWGAYIPEGFQTSCTFDYLSTEPQMRSFLFGMYIGNFAIPLAIIFICYFFILKAIRDHEREMSKVVDKLKAHDLRKKQDKASMEIKVARIAMMIITLFIVSWSPYATVALIGQFGPSDWVTPVMSEIPVMLAKACAMHNPIVYAFSHPKFREALANRAPWLMCCCDVKSSSTSSKVSRDPMATKKPLSRNMSGDSNYCGSEASSYVSNISEPVYDKNALGMSRQQSPESSLATNEVIIELVHALVTVSNRGNIPESVVPTNETDVTMNPEDLAKILQTYVSAKRAQETASGDTTNSIPKLAISTANDKKKY